MDQELKEFLEKLDKAFIQLNQLVNSIKNVKKA